MIALTVLVLLIVVHVAGRYFFKAPVQGAVEIAQSAMVLIVFASMAYVTLKRGNVKVTLVTTHFPEGVQTYLEAAMSLIGAAIFAIISWQLALTIIEAWQQNMYTDSLRLPVFPLKVVATIATLVMCAELLIRSVRLLLKRGGR
ncbi:MAG: TRAP transporter small permease [Chloroflexota bacterium]